MKKRTRIARTTMEAMRLRRALLRSRKFNGMLSLAFGFAERIRGGFSFEDSFEGVGDFDVG